MIGGADNKGEKKGYKGAKQSGKWKKAAENEHRRVRAVAQDNIWITQFCTVRRTNIICCRQDFFHSLHNAIRNYKQFVYKQLSIRSQIYQECEWECFLTNLKNKASQRKPALSIKVPHKILDRLGLVTRFTGPVHIWAQTGLIYALQLNWHLSLCEILANWKQTAAATCTDTPLSTSLKLS